MQLLTIQIGNSDNKLSQGEWSHYVESVRIIIEKYAQDVHFFGGSPNWYPWQNVAWCITLHPHVAISSFRDELSRCRSAYKQKSIAFTVGETQFI